MNCNKVVNTIMSLHLSKNFFFISDFNKEYINKVPKKTAFIYRNYEKEIDIDKLIDFKKACKNKNKLLFIANEMKIAFKYSLNGVYIPSFNNQLNLNIKKRKNSMILGSAHNLREIKIKEKQNVDIIFLAPLFFTKKSNKFLDICNFNKLSISTKKKVVALGGIKKENLNKLRILKVDGFASISYFNKIVNKNE